MAEPLMKKAQIKLWFLIPLIVFIGLVVMFFFRLGKPTTVVMDNALNRPMPSFELPLLEDMSQNATNDMLPNNPYMLNVYGSWCATCYEEHPFFIQLKQQGVDIVGINYKDKPEDALNYLEKMGNPYVFSIYDFNGKLAIDLGLTGAPESFIVDSQGNIRQHIVGDVNEQNWQARIEPCMNMLKEIGQNGDDLNSPDITAKISEVCK